MTTPGIEDRTSALRVSALPRALRGPGIGEVEVAIVQGETVFRVPGISEVEVAIVQGETVLLLFLLS